MRAATASATARPRRERASRNGISAAQARTGGSVCETDAAGQRYVLYVFGVTNRKSAVVRAASRSGSPRGVRSRARRSARTATAQRTASTRTPLTRGYHWCPATWNFAYAPTRSALATRPLSSR